MVGWWLCLNQFDQVALGKQVERQQPDNVLQRRGHFVAELEVRQQQIHAHREPNLCRHGVLAGAQEGLDLEVLLDPLEEQLDLPTLLVNVRDSLCRQFEVVGDEGVFLLRLGIKRAVAFFGGAGS